MNYLKRCEKKKKAKVVEVRMALITGIQMMTIQEPHRRHLIPETLLRTLRSLIELYLSMFLKNRQSDL